MHDEHSRIRCNFGDVYFPGTVKTMAGAINYWYYTTEIKTENRDINCNGLLRLS